MRFSSILFLCTLKIIARERCRGAFFRSIGSYPCLYGDILENIPHLKCYGCPCPVQSFVIPDRSKTGMGSRSFMHPTIPAADYFRFRGLSQTEAPSGTPTGFTLDCFAVGFVRLRAVQAGGRDAGHDRPVITKIG